MGFEAEVFMGWMHFLVPNEQHSKQRRHKTTNTLLIHNHRHTRWGERGLQSP